MSGRANNCDVKGGRIRVICARCKTVRYVAVSQASRKKTVRCRCGKVTYFNLNHRGYYREKISGQGEIILSKISKYRVHLRDVSQAGIGFIVRGNAARILATNRDLTIQYKNSNGASILRKIRIKNVAGSMVGAEFIDSLAQLARKVS